MNGIDGPQTEVAYKKYLAKTLTVHLMASDYGLVQVSRERRMIRVA